MSEIYVSTDVETDGPVAGRHSMLSIGSAAFAAGKILLSTFSANLETVAGLESDDVTTAWWATQPEAWKACRQNPEAPSAAMALRLRRHRGAIYSPGADEWPVAIQC